jgi:hypothetical protein
MAAEPGRIVPRQCRSARPSRSLPDPSSTTAIRRSCGNGSRLNRKALIAYWNGDLLTDEVIARLRPIASPAT